MTVHDLGRPAPEVLAGLGLAHVDYVDVFGVDLSRRAAPDLSTVHDAFWQQAIPVWARRLMRVRDLLVRPLGLKPATGPGLFRLIRSTATEQVRGGEDSHLDLRIALRLDAAPDPQTVRFAVVTAVQFHNALGRGYFAVVRPFHRVLVRSGLRRLERAAR